MASELDNNSSLEFVVLEVRGVRLASSAYWQRVLCRLQTVARGGQHPIAVCSAPKSVTNSLEAILHERNKQATNLHLRRLWDKHDDLCSDMGLDTVGVLGSIWSKLEDLVFRLPSRGPIKPVVKARIIACGELMATKIGAAWIARQGVRVRWGDARALLRVPLGVPWSGSSAQLAKSILAEGEYDATITQGSIASNATGDTVLLGPGRANDSADCLTSMLEAERFELKTDETGRDHLPSAQLLLAALSEPHDQVIATSAGTSL